ncbi:MAG TPA: hypothetical protein V6D08_00935 [Candidatus Obscuribacterales bacterium]
MTTQVQGREPTPRVEDRLALYTTQAVGQVSDEIVSRVESFANRFQGAFESTEATRSPLRNVLAVAASPESGVKALQNFILYQGGRAGSGSKFWTHKDASGALLAPALVAELNKLDDIHQNVCNLISERSGEKLSNLEKNRLRLRLMQLFIGYLARTQVALSGTKKHK